MTPKNKSSSRKGYFVSEILVGMVIMAVVAALMADAICGYYRVRSQYDWRRAAVWAAAGQLQRCQAGAAIDTAPPENLWPEEIKLETTACPGQGAWQGFQLVTVTATVDVARGPAIREQVSGYVRERATP
jgi:hypothetical protein